ncbi:transmembrane protein 104 isoform X1 [Octopus bimaculoides]|uniref:transmembrane protein 104 isoform X1 n=2 Tax=Octopus bimaculoides TaxID=37653 RepID=UPI0022E6FB5E|nr:transmembrane protein 104 isoform X1 [Octopus bimaculoides]
MDFSIKAYSPITPTNHALGLIYVFNLIVGTGALAMPKSFHSAGWLLSIIFLVILAFISYLTVTFVTEAMAVANFKLKMGRNNKRHKNDAIVYENNEEQPLLDQEDDSDGNANKLYDITERVEMGHMASMFFNKVGVLFFYICIIVYLYGDLAIYGAAVPKSLRNLACTTNLTDTNRTVSDDDICWPGSDISRKNAYRIFIVVFALVLGPFTFFNVQKTGYLQVFTSVFRWTAFTIMVVLTAIRLGHGEGKGHPPIFNFSGIPNLFGVCVYSFMCHHSLPSLVTPIKNKNQIFNLLAADYFLILLFYALLSFTAIFAFDNINDVYTLNFFPNSNSDSQQLITDSKFLQYFLLLFPVFTLSTNFPIIAVTLRNNLKTLFFNPEKPYHWFIDRIFFPLLAIIPPLIIAIITDEVEFLVGITGSYAGSGIQYIVPALLVYFARKEEFLTINPLPKNKMSMFKSKYWVWFVMVWSAFCLIFVTANHVILKS